MASVQIFLQAQRLFGGASIKVNPLDLQMKNSSENCVWGIARRRLATFVVVAGEFLFGALIVPQQVEAQPKLPASGDNCNQLRQQITSLESTQNTLNKQLAQVPANSQEHTNLVQALNATSEELSADQQQIKFKCPITTPSSPDFNVTTYHYDTSRTGWNQYENVLATDNVSNASVGLRHTVLLDDQVDAQPLVVTGQTINGQGTHDVVYVATEGNTVYAIDSLTGAVLLSRNLGRAVPQSALPGQCNNNGPNIGITSTPVIDLGTRTIYLIAYTYELNRLKHSYGSVYRLHALDLSSLADKIPAVTVSATRNLTNGQKYSFIASVSRQRPALLEANGNIYAGFGSFCDIRADISRGWLLGWNAATLRPLPANQLIDRISPDTIAMNSVQKQERGWGAFFLSSIWMSGYGIAADAAGDVFFATGNSDSFVSPDGKTSLTTYAPPSNLQESVVRMSGDLTGVNYFTPSDTTPSDTDHGVIQRDLDDNDLGAGGVMLLPDQPGSFQHLAVAAGKSGPMYLLNRDQLGGNNNNAVGEYDIGGDCWCGPSYFVGADGIGRVVSSGGSKLIVWKVLASSSVTLVQESSAILSSCPQSINCQDPGFFTTVSSNGTRAGTAIIWAVSRPANIQNPVVTLHAFDAMGGTLLSLGAGTWPNTGGNANIVPVVANGQVYVASYRQLAIFGLGGSGKTILHPESLQPKVQGHQLFGIVRNINGTYISIETRAQTVVKIDIANASGAHLSVVPVVGRAVTVVGNYDSAGVMHAQVVLRAKGAAALWQADR